MIDRNHILQEIRRTAEDNGGTPLGRERFAEATGIRETDWSGRYWARWSDAVQEAGLPPNKMQGKFDDEAVLLSFVDEIRRLGRWPTTPELRLRRREDRSFPSHNVFLRLGSKQELASRILGYSSAHPGLDDILPIVALHSRPESVSQDEDAATAIGFVYLLRAGRYYKVGRTNDFARRGRELAIQLPEPTQTVHVIRTDDPVGIEAYWHARFADRRKNGEWFELTSFEVNAFKRRKFM